MFKALEVAKLARVVAVVELAKVAMQMRFADVMNEPVIPRFARLG